MNEVSRVGEVLEGYAVLVNQLMADWTPYVNDVTTTLSSGSYDAEDAAADFPQLAKLVTDSLMAIGSELVDAYAILTSDFSEQTLVAGYGADPAKATTTRTLTVKGDLVSVSGQVLPHQRVTPVPATLAPTHTQFELDVDADGIKARTYDGFVLVTDAAGSQEEIPVTVMIG
jgi:hypothetical protein